MEEFCPKTFKLFVHMTLTPMFWANMALKSERMWRRKLNYLFMMVSFSTSREFLFQQKMFIKYLEYQLIASSVVLVNMPCIFHFSYFFFPVLVKLLWFCPCCLTFGLLWAKDLPPPSLVPPPPPQHQLPADPASCCPPPPLPMLCCSLHTAVRYSFRILLFYVVTVRIFSLPSYPLSSPVYMPLYVLISAFIPVVLLSSLPALIFSVASCLSPFNKSSLISQFKLIAPFPGQLQFVSVFFIC